MSGGSRQIQNPAILDPVFESMGPHGAWSTLFPTGWPGHLKLGGSGAYARLTKQDMEAMVDTNARTAVLEALGHHSVICTSRYLAQQKSGLPGSNTETKMRHPEFQYLDLLQQILDRGDERIDRTGVGTRSIFGAMIRFDLSDGTIPILTTKRVFWKTAVKEMLWFLTGGTNIRELLRDNVRIWSDWPLARYRKETGVEISQADFEYSILNDDVFAKQWGELGPVYGKQWRRWVGANGEVHDQISTLIETLRHNPSSRRMLFHAWNVSELEQMALPPCHLIYQYHVDSRKKLNCLIFQRSCDAFLGQAFNLVGGSALLLMLAQQAELEPGELVWVGGDVHIYMNHLDQVAEQLTREPRPFPKMRLTRSVDSIDGYQIDDFEVSGYDPHPAIHGDVAV